MLFARVNNMDLKLFSWVGLTVIFGFSCCSAYTNEVDGKRSCIYSSFHLYLNSLFCKI